MKAETKMIVAAAEEWIASVTAEAANNTFSASEGQWVFNLYGKNPLA